MRKIAVTTPAGQVGNRVVKGLIERGANVIAIGLEHHRASLQELTKKGVDFRIASQDDASALTKATQEASALFWLTPPNVKQDMRSWYEQTARAGAEAIQLNGIEHVVHLSSIGAGSREGLGTVTYVGETEKILNEVSKNIVHLRPGYFMENLLLQRENLAQGFLEFPYSPEHDIPWIAAKDMGEVAAKFLADSTWRGRWYQGLMGPENLSSRELAERLTKAFGRLIIYRQKTFEELRSSMTKNGLSTSAAEDLVLTMKALGDPDGIYAQPRTPDAMTPTTLEAFLKEAF